MDELEHNFLTAHSNYKNIDASSLPSNSKEYQQLVLSTLSLLNNVADLVSQLHVFSNNEELDDIASDSIKYILTPYYQAELQLLVVDKERLDHLNSAKGYFARFMQQCEKLKLIHKDDLRVLSSDNTENPTERRATLLARFKREKDIKNKLEEIQKLIAQGSAADEELKRSNWITIINHNTIKSIKQVESTEMELKMLEFAAQDPSDQVIRDSRGNAVRSAAPAPKPVAYTILPGGDRRDLTAQVFRPHYNMATITPEQAADAEIRAGRMVKGGGNEKKAESDDEDEDDEDKLRKARAWDDFKDDNPYGSGNTKR